jgi:hypothetical protein
MARPVCNARSRFYVTKNKQIRIFWLISLAATLIGAVHVMSYKLAPARVVSSWFPLGVIVDELPHSGGVSMLVSLAQDSLVRARIYVFCAPGKDHYRFARRFIRLRCFCSYRFKNVASLMTASPLCRSDTRRNGRIDYLARR